MSTQPVAAAYWMRPVSFARLHRILLSVASYPAGLAAGEFDRMVSADVFGATQYGKPPARTTLYHYRNTLTRLGALSRCNRRYYANWENAQVHAMLAAQSPLVDGRLDPVAREAFGDLAVRQRDCRALFFDLFMDREADYGAQDFRAHATPVSWRWWDDAGQRQALLLSEARDGPQFVGSVAALKSILYGIRYWARDELLLVDEFYREDIGAVLYPVAAWAPEALRRAVVLELLAHDAEGDWTTYSIRDLVTAWCVPQRQPIAALFDAIRWLSGNWPAYVVLMPTSLTFATLTARSKEQRNLQLRNYYQDAQRRLVSHFRIHRKLRELMSDESLS